MAITTVVIRTFKVFKKEIIIVKKKKTAIIMTRTSKKNAATGLDRRKKYI